MIHWKHLTACCVKKTRGNDERNKEKDAATVVVPVEVSAVLP